MQNNLIDNESFKNYLLSKMLIFSCKNDESLQTYLKYFKTIKENGREGGGPAGHHRSAKRI